MARRSEHTQEQIREMVLKAAENIVIEEGFKALTVRKVAMDIGYTVGSIYMVYANMDDLIMHIKAKTLDELAEHMRSIKPPANVEQHIQSLADIYLAFAHQHFNRWRMIFDAQSDAPVPDWYQQKVQNMFVIVEDLFQRLLPEQSAEQVRLAARALWCGVHGVCVLSLNGSLGGVGAENAEATIGLLVQNFIQGWKQKVHQADA
ncbi:TetR/AcrR family transcriptional regulator [Methylomonas sp. LL1]|uniref:TetR/AcrR family transcriptional regulator n=1 Tax=Methylomonas sp. LL1 TaxID=2785785 RepID=UPI0018C3BD45|nr:WHG domain-containing protein [Methylomonas sp. LL1]QPK65034.1 TetR/AcrR family transcriptional regulator [Methylomonas sp. LL1]